MSPLKPSTIRFDATFEKQWQKYLRRLTAKEKQQLRDRLTLFKEDIFDSRLKTHHLKGNLKQYYAFSISYSDRMCSNFSPTMKSCSYTLAITTSATRRI